jgi:hypothetical protein
MTNFYILEKTELGGVNAVVLANGVHSPLEQKNELEQHLRCDGVRGKVLFDLFLSLGTKGRRYFISNFDGKSLTPLERATDVPCSYTTQSAEILQRHSNELDLSLLTDATAFAVRQGYVIPV